MTLDDASRRELPAIEEAVEARAFLIREYFERIKRPRWRSPRIGWDFKQLAGTTGQSHVAPLQRWSRCGRPAPTPSARGSSPEPPEVRMNETFRDQHARFPALLSDYLDVLDEQQSAR